MLERGKHSTSAATTRALPVSGGNQINLADHGIKLSLHLPNERYACNSDNLYAVPRTDLHEVEWIEPDSVDAELSRLVAGSSTTATTTTTYNNARRCCRTSTSSGYSSHSPPLSAGSYSCYAVPGHGSFQAAPFRDQFGGLAVIHEAEVIPRPIWPSGFPGPREFYHNNDNPEYDALYACCECSCAYTYSYCDWDYGQASSTSAHEVLLELSRTLNSVIKGETKMTPEEILHDISHTVAQGMGLKGEVYEYNYHNPALFPSSKKSRLLFNNRNVSANEKKSSLLNSNNCSKVNPVNSRLYTGTRHLYMHNPGWATSRCACERNHRFLESNAERDQIKASREKKKNSPAVFLVHEQRKSGFNEKINGSLTCRCLSRSNCHVSATTVYSTRHIGTNTTEPNGLSVQPKQSRNGLSSGKPRYMMQLECSDGGSSSEGITVSSGKEYWNHRGFDADLDFTLDVSRAERLGRAIAKAKRKRQWCRALTAFFGLVFFVLSVVVVSLSVTRGRKVFGSM